MLNKKGTSIIELIVSIALLSLVLSFMLKLLVDLNNVRTNTNFAKDNQIVRAEVIRTIENVIKDKKITNIAVDNGNSNADVLRIVITYSDNKISTIDLRKNTLTFEFRDEKNNLKKRVWTMNNCTIYKDSVYINNYSIDDLKSNGFIMNIQIHTANDENNTVRNNPLDDIQISYYNSDYDSSEVNIPSVLQRY